MKFLSLEDKTILIFGVANRRSVAYHIGQILEQQGARVIYSVRSTERRESLARLLEGREIHVCDVEREEEIRNLAEQVRVGLRTGRGSRSSVGDVHPTAGAARRGPSSAGSTYPTAGTARAEARGSSVGGVPPTGATEPRLHGIVHSIAFANYEGFSGAFHEVTRQDFLQAVDVSCYSLIAIARAFKDLLDEHASVVTISISTTQMAAESYGYMAPAKAALDSTVTFLAKSFSRFSKVRFNAVCAGLLKTSASAGIPNYMDNYLFAEQATLRKAALTVEEVANVAAFLLSDRSSGINAQHVVVDAGMGRNYFDADIVKHVTRTIWPIQEPPGTDA